jgi:phage gpG-like protein
MFGMPTVVIGTQRTPWLARLHEFGGTLQLTAYRIGVGAARNAYLRRSAGSSGAGRDSKGRFTKGVSLGPQKNQYEYGALIWANKRMKHSRNWDRTTITKSARYPARPFMQGAAGVQKAVAKANVKFRNMLRRAG